MNNTIWKFELKRLENQQIEMPVGAEILTLQAQYNIPCIWVLLDPDADKELREFETVGTGHLINTSLNRKYIGTFQILDGKLVLHVFELTKD